MQQFRGTFKGGRHRMASITSTSCFQYLLLLLLWKSHPQRTVTWLSEVGGLKGKATGRAVLAKAPQLKRWAINPASCQTGVLVSLSVTITKHADKSSYEREGLLLLTVPGRSPSLQGHQGRNERQLLTFTVKSREGTHTRFSRSVIFFTSTKPRTTNTGNSAAQSGLCLPIPISVIQTNPLRHRHRLTSSRRPPLRLSSQMILYGVKLAVKTNHDSCLLNWNFLACP